MKLLFLTACFTDDETYQRSFQYMIRSVEKHGIDLKRYGNNEYLGWIDIKVAKQLEYLESVSGYTHVLYTDGRDAFFTEGEKNIVKKYKSLGSPELLMSRSNSPQWEYEVDASLYPDGFVHSGGYIGEIDFVTKTLKEMLKYEDFGDDSHTWNCRWKEGFRPKLDKDSIIFQNIQNEEPWNGVSSIIHIAGGYSDPKNGKLEILKRYYE